jgi:hypothetical protein
VQAALPSTAKVCIFDRRHAAQSRKPFERMSTPGLGCVKTPWLAIKDNEPVNTVLANVAQIYDAMLYDADTSKRN